MDRFDFPDRPSSERQASLFETEPAPWELDDAERRLVAGVVLGEGPDGEFDYLVPEALAERLEPGMRVEVPLGRGDRPTMGYCVRLEIRPVGTRRLKYLARILDPRRLLSPEMLRLTRWMAEYYLSSLGQVLKTVVPGGVRMQAGTRVATLLFVPPEVAARRAQLQLPPKQALAFEALSGSPKPLTATDLARKAGCTTGPIAELRKKGLIRSESRRVPTVDCSEVPPPREANLELNAAQRLALDAVLAALRASEHRTILLHGVTGSGKTEVYMQAITEVVSYGRQAIVLVPEISLTPQTVDRFRRRFSHVAVLHSHMGDAERAWHWEQINAGKVEVVVGARSAVFAPTPHLGLLVLDEEHEGSFKQDQAPRYHARDVAMQRAAAEKIPLVLGSATPSLESWQRAAEGRYTLIELPERVLRRPLPDVRTIDLRTDSHRRVSRGAISRSLHQAIDAALRDGGQVILLLNRRGYSTHIQCPSCGYVVACPGCDIALTHHHHEEKAMCHYCEFEMPTPLDCPQCHSPSIRFRGRGTQKLEAEVRARFTGVSVLRMDTDSMRKAGSHQQALARFRAGEVQILLGTQMIAKGLDFPNVTLVGVVAADTALHLPDFRAAERTFQLVTQVAGRTGRGEKGGRVLVQTCTPDHPAIVAAVRHNYHAFARSELPAREASGYPPFSQMIRLVVRGPAEAVAREFADHAAGEVQRGIDARGFEARILGPAPAPLPKLRGNFRFHAQLQSTDGEALRTVVRDVLARLEPPQDVQWIADVDPLDML